MNQIKPDKCEGEFDTAPNLQDIQVYPLVGGEAEVRRVLDTIR